MKRLKMFNQCCAKEERKCTNKSTKRIGNEDDLGNLFPPSIVSSLFVGKDRTIISPQKYGDQTASLHTVSNCEQYGCSNDRKNITRNITGASVLNPFGNMKLLGKSYNTVDESNGEQYSVRSKKDSCGRMSKPHVLLPGDHVIFAESASAPGVPIIYRLEEEQQNNPDKLNLDRRKFTICPLLEGEENLRLLNLQHNLIKKIQHLQTLKKLIFLDLYDNQIEEISGLNGLSSLRVLMLGKNRIKKIANLDDLVMLDVLDLHGNKITKIENLSHLHHLRVLNLAGNSIQVVSDLSGLTQLLEINLRKNFITTLVDVDVLQLLQRIFLSFNEIKSFDDISCLRRCPMLSEISLDGNPFTIIPTYRQITLHEISSLKILDVKRVTEEERRIASVMVKREEERRKENDKLNSIKEKRRLAICNAQQQWDMQQQHHQRFTGHDEKSASPSQNDYSVCHLAELDHNSLNLYGSGSLDALRKSWGEKKSIITTITFRYIKFHEIVPFLSILNATFPSLERLYFDLTNISSLQELNALAVMKKLSHLTVTEEGNLVTNLSIWRLYLIYILNHLELSTLNQKQITGDDIYYASNMFSRFTSYRTSLISNAKLLVLLVEEGYEKLADSPAKSCLLYHGPSVKEKLEEAEHKSFASSFMREITKNAILAERKQEVFQNDWFTILNDIITKYFKDILNLDMYSQSSLEKTKKSVGIESSLSHYAN